MDKLADIKAANTEKMEKQREEREMEEQAHDDLKLVIDQAKLECSLCTNPQGTLKVNFDTPTTQDKKTATVKEQLATSLMFSGNCKKSPNSSSPCASVMQLGQWKDVGRMKVQDQPPLLLKSTIPCNYGGVDIKVTDCGQVNELEVLNTDGAPLPPQPFEITFNIDKNFNTIVPLGILDFEGNFENANFVFNYSLMLNDIDSLEFRILKEDGSTLYAITNLPEVVISSQKKHNLFSDISKKKPKYDPLNPQNVWDWKTILNQYNIAPNDYTKVGSYVIFWDGFDNNDVYNSTNFFNKKLKAQITARKNGIAKTREVRFSTRQPKVDWVDIKIDKNNKRIDVDLRVNLKDGGAKGFEKHIAPDSSTYPATKYKDEYDWEKIPQSELAKRGKSPIKARTRSFQDLEKLTIEGVNYHWGRNRNHAVAKDVKIVNDAYEVYTSATNMTEQAIGAMKLIYNTNGEWMRSGNPGSIKDPMTAIGNLVSRQAICYNVGYIEYSNSWGFQLESNEDIEFRFTSAHEIGHEILKKYGGTIYSYGHKGSVNSVTQNMKDQAPAYPTGGEIDIMPYYPSNPRIEIYNRYAAAEKDVLGLIWLTKIEIK